MAKHGILVDYEWCTGCHSCEFACQMEHGFPVGQTGVMVKEVGPYQIEGDHWQYAYMPVPTDQCDLCADRVAMGKKPTCVSHCQAVVLEYGAVEDLAKKLDDKTKQCLYVLGE